MKIESLLKKIGDKIPSIDPFDEASEVVDFMISEDIAEVPVVYTRRFLGLVNRTVLLDSLRKKRENGGSVLLELKKDVVVADYNDEVEDVIRRLTSDQLVIPVLRNGKFLRALYREDLLRELISMREETINHLNYYITGFGVDR